MFDVWGIIYIYSINALLPLKVAKSNHSKLIKSLLISLQNIGVIEGDKSYLPL